MPKMLTKLRIREVSSVDRGAGEGVKIMLMKSDSFKKEDTQMSKIGKLFGSFFGGGDNSTIIDKSVESLAESVTSILADDGDDVKKGEALTQTFEQFGDHLKSTLTAGPQSTSKGASDMDISVLRKALGLADSATEADVTEAIAKSHKASQEAAATVKKLAKELDLAKADYTEAEVAYLKKESLYDEEEDEKPELSDGEKKRKKAFRDASHEDRAKIMKASEPEMPAYIKKMYDELAEVKKQNSELLAKVASVDFAKRAAEIGLPESQSETVRKAYAGDAGAVDELLGIIKSGIAATKAGKLFGEFGSKVGKGVSDDPMDQLMLKADELRKANPNLTQAQAFAKVYEDPANIELTSAERGKNRPQAA